MSKFKKLNTKIYTKSGPEITPDYVYWKKLGTPVLVKEFGPIDYIDFSPVEPYHFAVTCSVRVQIYNPITKLPVKKLTRFRENAHGAVFRSDGALLCAGSDEAAVKLFNVSTKSMLRLFKGHEAPVHRTFFVDNKPQIVSFSDDKSVRLWDIPSEKNVLTFREHSDYIRSGAVNPNLPDIVLSGGYDNIVKMYDIRTENAVLSVDHGSPVESLLFLPSGGIFLSAGGTTIKIWDAIGGGRLLGSISQHHKTITCMQLASDNKRLLSGGLDKHVKVYDINSYKVVHTMDYPNAILSLGVSKSDDTLVTGLVDGLICISRRQEESSIEKTEKKKVSHKYKSYTHHSTIDVNVPEEKIEKQSYHDTYLRKFQYSKALDTALKSYVVNKTPQVTVGVIQELVRRKALGTAFKDRDTKSILQILKFFNRHIANYKFTRILIKAVNVFLDVYQDSVDMMPTEVATSLNLLNQTITKEVDVSEKLSELLGGMHIILAAADTMLPVDNQQELKNLAPSVAAQGNFFISIS